jgi:dihydroorotate dehydrogenase (fumarate)
MDLSTTYLGLQLKNPLVVSSSKLTGNLRNVKECFKAGAGAVVLKSVFEEQIIARVAQNTRKQDFYFWFPEAEEFITQISKGPVLNEYLKLISDARKETDIPIIASVNCISHSEWVHFASKIEAAGAHALELNISLFPNDRHLKSEDIEEEYAAIVREVKKHTSIPISVKIGPFFTNMMAMAWRLQEAGADGLVLFNRFYNPDIDTSTGKVVTDNVFSSPDEKSLSMRWIALLTAKGFAADLAASTGIHYSIGVVKQLMAGATVTQLCTTLYQNGIPYLADIKNGLTDWMKKHGFKTINDFRGNVSLHQENTAGFERLQYMKKNFD